MSTTIKLASTGRLCAGIALRNCLAVILRPEFVPVMRHSAMAVGELRCVRSPVISGCQKSKSGQRGNSNA
jgi:hypothetical protein